jgi:hypothetical protein
MKTPAEAIATYLRQEEALLAAALPLVQGLQAAFGDAGTAPAADFRAQQEFLKMAGEVNASRKNLHEEWARQWRLASSGLASSAFTMERALELLPEPERSECRATAERVQSLAQQVAAVNYTVSIHLRIHLSAYRRILRELTNTSAGSGRYGPAGKAESQDYRPLLHIHG